MVIDYIDVARSDVRFVLALYLSLSLFPSRTLHARSSGELFIYTAFSMLTYTPWGYFGNLSFVLLGIVPNLTKKDK